MSNQAVIFEYVDGSTSALIPADVAAERGLHDCPNHLVSPEGVPECVTQRTTVPPDFTWARQQGAETPQQHSTESQQGAETSQQHSTESQQGAETSQQHSTESQQSTLPSSLLGSDQPMGVGVNPLLAIAAVVLIGAGCTIISRFGGRGQRP